MSSTDIYTPQFCTYLTSYSGNKLPPFYIGSSSIERISLLGYKGSVQSKEYKKIWNLEIKNNPNLFKTIIITTHETRKEATAKELSFQKSVQAPKNPLYTNRAFAQVEGSHGHAVGLNIPRTPKSIRKSKESRNRFISSAEGLIYRKDLSDKMTGEGNPQFGKTGEQATCFGRTGELHPLFGKTGELSPNFGKKRSDEVKLSISINHADVSGSNNPRAKSWKLTSPQGIEYYCKGNIETIVEEHNLGISSLKKYLGSIVPPLQYKYNHPKTTNTVGWKLEILI